MHAPSAHAGAAMQSAIGVVYDGRVGAVRLELRLTSHTEWIKIFDPRDWTVFVPTRRRRSSNGTTLRIDLDVGGWLVTLRGTVVGHARGSGRRRRRARRRRARQDQLPERLRPRRPAQPAREAPAADPARRSPTAPSRARRTRSPRTSTRRACSCSPTSRCPRPRRSTCSSTVPGQAAAAVAVGKVSHTIIAAGRRAARHGHRVRARRRAARAADRGRSSELEDAAATRASCRPNAVE